MERNIFFAVLGATLLLIAVAMLIPGQPRERAVDLPWQIEPVGNGSIRVFGLTLGQSTLADAQHKLGDEATISMFARREGDREHYVVEAYFDSVTLSGLRAAMVMIIDIPAEIVQQVYQRGVRITRADSGEHKISLASEDLQLARDSVISSITYIPRSNLDEELILKRFGIPAQRSHEADGNTEHFLYPQLGLDIALNTEGKEILQYVAPSQFDRLLAPLLQNNGEQARPRIHTNEPG